jgi:hypothetical protein
MATIQELMPYLKQGYIANDQVRHTYLEPKKQDDSIVFEWKSYEREGKWSGPETHTAEEVRTWESSGWGILCQRGGSEYAENEPVRIEQAIANGFAHKAAGF